MPFLRAMRRLMTLPLVEVGDLVTAQAYLLAARRALRRKPLGQLLRPVATAGACDDDASTDLHVERMATAIDRMARYGAFRPTCLVRAIALERVARRLNSRAAVRIGVHRRRDALLAHAWIECGGRVIGDDPANVRQFIPLHDFSALPE